MKPNKGTLVVVGGTALAVPLLLGQTLLQSEYLFGWAAHNWRFYLVLCAVVLLFLFFHRPLPAAFMATGIVTGIFIGNYVGALIKHVRESRIEEGMEAEMVYRLQHHFGFEIWMGVILLTLVIGIGVEKYVRRSS